MDMILKGREAAKKVEEMINDYDNKVAKELPTKNRWKKEKPPNKKQLIDALTTNIYNSKSPTEKIQVHWDAMKSLFDIYINETPYSSSPFGFRKAYENIVGSEIDHHEAIELQRDGLNLLPIDPEARISPVNPNVHPVFRTSEHGIILHHHESDYGKASVVRAGLAVGGYDDATSPEFILYDTSTKRSSYLRARHLEHLSEQIFDKEGQGLIIQIAGKVNIRGGLGGREYKSFYVMSLCEIIPQSRWDKDLLKKELKVYKDKLFLPYLLKPLDARYADSQLRVFQLLDTTIGEDDKYEVRPRISPPNLVKKYSYDSLKTKAQKKPIYDYIRSQNPKCSHAIKTGGKWSSCPETLKADKTTHIGHIFSKNWCTAYSIFQESMNHPDNLYLSCNRCNPGLGQGCPNKETLKRINNHKLTIGDLIRRGFLL